MQKRIFEYLRKIRNDTIKTKREVILDTAPNEGIERRVPAVQNEVYKELIPADEDDLKNADEIVPVEEVVDPIEQTKMSVEQTKKRIEELRQKLGDDYRPSIIFLIFDDDYYICPIFFRSELRSF